jgi:hypothetical protein
MLTPKLSLLEALKHRKPLKTEKLKAYNVRKMHKIRKIKALEMSGTSS